MLHKGHALRVFPRLLQMKMVFIVGIEQHSSIQSLALSFWKTAPPLGQLLFHLLTAVNMKSI